MKKFLAILLILISVLLCGCTSNKKSYPCVTLERDNYYSNDTHIDLRQHHTFNEHHLWDEKETEIGYDIIIHIIKDE